MSVVRDHFRAKARHRRTPTVRKKRARRKRRHDFTVTCPHCGRNALAFWERGDFELWCPTCTSNWIEL